MLAGPAQVRERGRLTVLQAEGRSCRRSETLQQKRGMQQVVSSGESLVVDRDGYHGTRKSQVVDGFASLSHGAPIGTRSARGDGHLRPLPRYCRCRGHAGPRAALVAVEPCRWIGPLQPVGLSPVQMIRVFTGDQPQRRVRQWHLARCSDSPGRPVFASRCLPRRRCRQGCRHVRSA